MDAIEICEDTFHASTPLDQLVNYPIRQLRTLFKMMFKNDYEEVNREAILVMNEWLPRKLENAKVAWAQASKEYAAGWKSISCPYGQTPGVKALNKKLTSDVIRTRNYYTAIQKLQKNYLQVKQDYKRRHNNNDPLKVLTGECRLSYVHLTEPYAHEQGQDEKYSATLLIPKTDYATKADIDSAMQAAIAEGVTKTWSGQRPAMPAIPIYDGDGVRPNGEPFSDECKGCWVITAGSKADKKPEVVHISNIHTQLSPADIYSGMYARVTVRFFAYNRGGKRGIGCGLGNVLKTREGDPLSAGRASAENDFASLEQTAPPAPAYGYQPAVPAGYQPPMPAPAYGYQPGIPAGYQPAAPAGYQPAAPAYGAPTPAQTYPGINPFTGLPV